MDHLDIVLAKSSINIMIHKLKHKTNACAQTHG